MKTSRAAFLGAVEVLLSMSALAQVPIEADPAAFASSPVFQPAMRVISYSDEMYAPPIAAPGVPYASCYRIGRCSASDLYRFRDRPNRLTRLAPEAPPESAPPPAYLWFLVPVTPEENILPKYRSVSQVRDEYRDVGRPIDDPD